MKLTDLIHQAGSASRNAINFVRHPGQILSYQARNIAQARIEEIEIPIGQDRRLQTDSSQPQQTMGDANRSIRTSTLRYSDTSVAVQESPITQIFNSATTSTGRKIAGRRGKYQIEKLLKDGERVRQYQGSWLANNTSVLVQEYLLTEFNQREVAHVKDQLEHIESVSFKNGGGQDFRLIVPWDAAIDLDEKRGYLITRHTLEHRITLREFLTRTGTMPPRQVRQVLYQVLQTLLFLHNHTIRFSDGSTQRRVAHGNLSLDSLSIAPTGFQVGLNEAQFYIYVSDLELWEAPFRPLVKAGRSTVKPISSNQEAIIQNSINDDLIRLGRIGAVLLMGEVYDRPTDPSFDPKNYPVWATIPDEPLQQFIRQLMRLDYLSFSSTEEARKALFALPPPTQVSPEPEIREELAQQSWQRPLRWLMIAVLLTTVGWLGWVILGRLFPSVPDAPLPPIQDNRFAAMRDVEELNDLPKGVFKYAVVSDLWRDVLAKGRVSPHKSFQEELGDRAAKLKQFKAITPKKSEIGELRAGRLAFVLSDSSNPFPEQGFESIPVAYDGLVVFVAASDPQRRENIPVALDGKINFDQLRQIYIENDKQYKPFIPNDPIAIDLFEKTIYQVPEEQQQFRRLAVEIEQPINRIFENILQGFENREIEGIGFGRLSKVFGQCSVYPLAVGEPNREVQALVQDDGTPLSPKLDLCNAKGSYWSNTEEFKDTRYPFVYPLSITYFEGNKKSKQAAIAFAKALETDEGQCLLSEAGFVPIHPVRQLKVCGGVQKPKVVQQWLNQLVIPN